MSGGSQPSGSMSYPTHINDAHKLMLSDGVNNAVDAIDEAIAANPYLAAYSYDPTADLQNIENELSSLDAEVESALAALDFSAMVATAEGEADTILMDAADIDAAVAAFETKQEGTLAKNRARYAAGLAAIGAETSSAFWIGLGLIEQGFNTAVAEYRSQVTRETNARRTDFVLQGVNAITNQIAQKVNLKNLLGQAISQAAAQRIIASKEYLNEELQIQERAVTWDLEQLHAGSSMLGAVAGVGMRKTPMPAWASALSGVMSGIGAMAPLATATGSVPLGLLSVLIGGAISGAAGATEGY